MGAKSRYFITIIVKAALELLDPIGNDGSDGDAVLTLDYDRICTGRRAHGKLEYVLLQNTRVVVTVLEPKLLSLNEGCCN